MLRLFVTLLAVLVPPAFGQDVQPYGGEWSVHATLPDGSGYDAHVTIEGQGGWWKASLHDRENPCLGVRAPLTVTESTPERLVLRVKESGAMPGCRDYTVTFTRTDEKTLSGTLGRQKLVARR